MHRLALFSCGQRCWTAAEVVSGADFRGELTPVRTMVAAGLAVAAHAEQAGVEVDDALLQQCSDQYRQDRGLASADATSRWLAAHGLDLDDFADFLERRLLLTQFEEELKAIVERQPPDRDEVQALVWPELALSGAAGEPAMWLARRVALREANAVAVPPGEAALSEERTRFFERSGITESDVSRWCAAYGCTPSWVEELTALEALYRGKRTELLRPAAFDEEIARKRQDLMCIEVEAAAFEQASAAREAFLCVTEDGEGLPDVSRRGNAGLYHTNVYLETLDARLQQQLLSGAPGDVLPPFEGEGKFWVYRIRSKTEPDLADPHVRERLEHNLITRYFDDLVVAHVQFHDPPHSLATKET